MRTESKYGAPAPEDDGADRARRALEEPESLQTVDVLEEPLPERSGLRNAPVSRLSAKNPVDTVDGERSRPSDDVALTLSLAISDRTRSSPRPRMNCIVK